MKILYSYEATNNSDSFFLWLGIIICIVAFGGAAFFLKKKGKGREHTINVLIAMLFFFLGLISFSTSFFSGWSMRKLGHVNLYANSISIGSQNIDYSTIRKITYKEEKSGSFLDPNSSVQHDFFLVIQCNNNKVHVIPGDSYPIREIREHIEKLR